jgi:Tfp pilus assembly protein FimT
MHAPGRGDAGIGLVELLMAIVLLGIGAVAVLAGFATTIKMSALHKDQTEATGALAIAAEAVSSPFVAYQPCAGDDPGTGTYRSAIDQALGQAANTNGVGFSVDYWNGSGFDTTCRDTDGQVPAFGRMQQITLSTTVKGQSNTWTLVVLKRAA